MNPQKTLSQSLNNLILDDSYRPLLEKYYSSIDVKNQQQLIDSINTNSILSIHQSIIQINKNIQNNQISIITKLLKSGIFYKFIVFLNDEQNPQLILQALRLIYNTSKFQSIRNFCMSQGLLPKIVGLINDNQIECLKNLAILTLQTFIKHHQKEDKDNFVGWSEQIARVSQWKQDYIPEFVIQSLINICYHDLLFKVQDIEIFMKLIVGSLSNNRIESKSNIARCLVLFKNNPQYFLQHFKPDNLQFVLRIIREVSDKQVSIRALALKGIVSLPLSKNYNLRVLLMHSNVFEIFEPVLSDTPQRNKYLYCLLVQSMLSSSGQQQQQVLYFLSHSSVIKTLSILLLTSHVKIAIMICSIFSSLCQCNRVEVITFYRQSNIIQYYIKAVQKHKKHIAFQALSDVLNILSYLKVRDSYLCDKFCNLISEQALSSLQTIKFSSKQMNEDFESMIKRLKLKFFIAKDDKC